MIVHYSKLIYKITTIALLGAPQAERMSANVSGETIAAHAKVSKLLKLELI